MNGPVSPRRDILRDWTRTYAKPRAGATVEAFRDREGKQANRKLENEEMPRRESFPPNDDDKYYELPPAGRPHTRVTDQTVEQAL